MTAIMNVFLWVIKELHEVRSSEEQWTLTFWGLILYIFFVCLAFGTLRYCPIKVTAELCLPLPDLSLYWNVEQALEPWISPYSPRRGFIFFLTQGGWEGWTWPGWQSLDLHLERDKIRHCSKQLTADLSRYKMQMSLECILIISTFCWIDWNANPMRLKAILHSVSKEAGPPWSSMSHQHSLHPSTACARFYSLLGKQLEDLCPPLANS